MDFGVRHEHNWVTNFFSFQTKNDVSKGREDWSWIAGHVEAYSKTWESKLWWRYPLRAKQSILSPHKSKGSVREQRWREGALRRILTKDIAGMWWPQDEGLDSGRWTWKGRGRSQSINCNSNQHIKARGAEVGSPSSQTEILHGALTAPGLPWAQLSAGSVLPSGGVGAEGRSEWFQDLEFELRPGRVLWVAAGLCWGSEGEVVTLGSSNP